MSKRILEEGEIEREDESLKKSCTKVTIDELTCPITKEIFNQPVIADDGFTYEKWAIDKCINGDGDGVSPMTREPITEYFENKIVKNLVIKLLEHSPELKEEQFGSDVYNDYLQNKDCCIKLVKHKNFTKFSESTSIRLLDNLCHDRKNYTLIQYVCINFNTEINIFEKILTNSFDLNCHDQLGNTPLFYITKHGTLQMILTSLRLGADIINISNTVARNMISTIARNQKMTDSDKKDLLEYILTNHIIQVFNSAPICILHIFDFDENIIEKFFNIITRHDESLYELISLELFTNIFFSVTYTNLCKLLDRIEPFEYSVDKIYTHYEQKYKNSKIVYLNCMLKELYQTIIDNADLEDNEKISLIQRLKKICDDKIQVDIIDTMLLSLHAQKQKDRVNNNIKDNNIIYDGFMVNNEDE